MTAFPSSDTFPESFGPDVPSLRHSCHWRVEASKRSNRSRWSVARSRAGTVTAKAFCTFAPSISMPSRESASALDGAGGFKLDFKDDGGGLRETNDDVGASSVHEGLGDGGEAESLPEYSGERVVDDRFVAAVTARLGLS